MMNDATFCFKLLVICNGEFLRGGDLVYKLRFGHFHLRASKFVALSKGELGSLGVVFNVNVRNVGRHYI